MYVNNITPALQLEGDFTSRIQRDRNQVVANCAIDRARAIREIRRIDPARFAALLGKLAPNSGVSDTNHSLLSPARSSVNRGASFRRVNVDLRKVQHSRTAL